MKYLAKILLKKHQLDLMEKLKVKFYFIYLKLLQIADAYINNTKREKSKK